MFGKGGKQNKMPLSIMQLKLKSSAQVVQEMPFASRRENATCEEEEEDIAAEAGRRVGEGLA